MSSTIHCPACHKEFEATKWCFRCRFALHGCQRNPALPRAGDEGEQQWECAICWTMNRQGGEKVQEQEHLLLETEIWEIYQDLGKPPDPAAVRAGLYSGNREPSDHVNHPDNYKKYLSRMYRQGVTERGLPKVMAWYRSLGIRKNTAAAMAFCYEQMRFDRASKLEPYEPPGRFSYLCPGRINGMNEDYLIKHIDGEAIFTAVVSTEHLLLNAYRS